MKENVIKLHDKKFKVMIPAAKIEEAVAAVAAKINEDYRDCLLYTSPSPRD